MGRVRRVRTLALGGALQAALALAGLAPASLAACSSSPAGVDACKQIEAARCHAASSCGVSIQPPYSTAGTDVDACIRYYDVACLHGLASGDDPGSATVSACVAAINDHPCAPGGPNLVLAPESDPKCSWLVPTPPPTLGGEAGASTDATADAADAATE